ncbi:MAG: SUMF1/EgtB/PvdO family nonheme iron enzyme, partial [Lentimicrobiaceae bacterium]|nr:SUMF1/EgtB/PvdO family nonheme iron enzyme [Lentimicrobiaceae bacterium]
MKKYYFLALFAILPFFFQKGYTQENLTFTVNGVPFTMIFVEGGSFIMGCTPEQGNCYEGERPTHKVTLPDFFMGEFQVTQKLWHAVMGANLQQQWLSHTIAERSNLIELARRLKSSAIKVNTNTFWDIGVFTAEDYSKVITTLGSVGDNYPIYFIS